MLVNFCDEMRGKEFKKVLFVSFGVGLSTATCVLNLTPDVNLGVHFYEPTPDIETRKQTIQKWIDFCEGKN